MTNEVLSQLHRRTSVRAYLPKAVPEDVKQAVVQAAIQAPSAGNMALYTILDITDPQIKAALAESCDHQPFIATAPMVLIFCADYRRWYRLFCATAGEPVRQPGLGDWLLAHTDAVIAAQNAVVAAQSLGLGSCYIGDILENWEFHRKLLNLPGYVLPAAMVCFGYPTKQQLLREKPPRFSPDQLLHENGYRQESPDRMLAMLEGRNGQQGQALLDYLQRFRRRKWDCDFSREMTRSVQAMLADWEGPGKEGL